MRNLNPIAELGAPLFRRLLERLALERKFLPIECPSCGSSRARNIIKRDRYLLKCMISSCNNCGLIYTSRNLKGELLTDFYRTSYRLFYENVTTVDDAYIHETRDRLKAAFRLARIREIVGDIHSVVEFGSGLGYFLYECKHQEKSDVFGVELGETFSNYSSNELGLGSCIQVCDLLDLGDLPFTPQIIAAFHVLEHVEDPKRMLMRIRDWMSPFSSLVLEVPDIEGDWRSINLSNFHFGHRSYFSAATLNNLLADVGLEPYYLSRSSSEGIYPGNLRVFARLSTTKVPRLDPATDRTEQHIRQTYRPWDLSNGLPKAALKLLR